MLTLNKVNTRLEPGGVESGKNLFEVSKRNAKYWQETSQQFKNITEDRINSFMTEVSII